MSLHTSCPYKGFQATCKSSCCQQGSHMVSSLYTSQLSVQMITSPGFQVMTIQRAPTQPVDYFVLRHLPSIYCPYWAGRPPPPHVGGWLQQQPSLYQESSGAGACPSLIVSPDMGRRIGGKRNRDLCAHVLVSKQI